MSAPIHKLRKDEIIKLSKGKCKEHGHNYLEHYNCYLIDNPSKPERLGYFDIEASNLVADYGIMLSYCIKDGLSKKIYGDVLTPLDVKKGHEDKRIVANCIKDLQQFDRIITFYGTNFDLPFLRARALIVGVPFPTFGTLKHRDAYFIMKSRFKLSSRRLENSCRQLLGMSDKTKIDAVHWRNGVRGDKKALNYIYTHNRYDVLDLEKLYLKIQDYSKMNNTSI